MTLKTLINVKCICLKCTTLISKSAALKWISTWQLILCVQSSLSSRASVLQVCGIFPDQHKRLPGKFADGTIILFQLVKAGRHLRWCIACLRWFRCSACEQSLQWKELAEWVLTSWEHKLDVSCSFVSWGLYQDMITVFNNNWCDH